MYVALLTCACLFMLTTPAQPSGPGAPEAHPSPILGCPEVTSLLRMAHCIWENLILAHCGYFLGAQSCVLSFWTPFGSYSSSVTTGYWSRGALLVGNPGLLGFSFFWSGGRSRVQVISKSHWENSSNFCRVLLKSSYSSSEQSQGSPLHYSSLPSFNLSFLPPSTLYT